MPWVRLDEEFPKHPKVLRAGPQAAWLHVCALCWSNRYLTDGFVPEEALPALADFGGVMVRTAEALTERPVTHADLVARLVDVGLWEEAEGGWQIHDFHDYQPSRRDVEQKTGHRRVAGRRRAHRARRDGDGRFSPHVENRMGGGPEPPAKPQVAPSPQPGPGTGTEGLNLSSEAEAFGGGAGGERRSAPDESKTRDPNDAQHGLLAHLRRKDPRFDRLSEGAIVSLNRRFSRPVVTTAIQRVLGLVSDGSLELLGPSPYPYLEKTCKDVAGLGDEEVSA